MLYLNQHDGRTEAEYIHLSAELVTEARTRNWQIFFFQDQLVATADSAELEDDGNEWEEMGAEHQENILARAYRPAEGGLNPMAFSETEQAWWDWLELQSPELQARYESAVTAAADQRGGRLTNEDTPIVQAIRRTFRKEVPR